MSNNGYKSDRVPRKIPKSVKDKKFPNMLRIIFEEGGEVPEVLSGMYGRQSEAQKAIDDWVVGYNRPKIYPKAPQNDIPQRKSQVENNGEEKGIS